MTFNLISLAVLFVAAFVVIFEIIRSVTRGVKKSILTLVSIFISAFLSIVVTLLLSDFISSKLLEKSSDLLNMQAMESIYAKFPHLNDVIFSYLDAIMSPVLFVILFFVLRAVVAVVLAIVLKSKSKSKDVRLYEHEDAPLYKKKPKPFAAIIGAVSGFLVVVICAMPIVGTLKMASITVHKINDTSSAFNFKIKQSLVNVIDVFSDDLAVNVLYYSGGSLFYKAVSTSSLNDNHFELEDEIVGTLDGIDDLLNVGIIMSNIAEASDEQKTALRGVGEKINAAETMKTLAADFINGLSTKWLKDEPFLNLEKPYIGRSSSIFFDKMLYVCKGSTPDTVGADFSTMINVFLIAVEHNILACEDYKTLLETANQTGAFNLIKEELNKNPRMAGISLEIDNMSVRAVASAITSFDPEDYEAITQNITDTLNEALALDPEERVAYITNYAERYINEYDIDLGPDITKEIAEQLSEDLLDTNEPVTVDEVKEFWDEYTLTQNDTLELDSDDKDKIDNIIENEGDIIIGEIQDVLDEASKN